MNLVWLSSYPAPPMHLMLMLLVVVVLPIPVRSQLSSSSLTPVLFPSSTASCVHCKPAFASPACQVILGAIAVSSTTPISNATLAACQCSETFLSLYDTCVQCFRETNQLKNVFGSNRAPPPLSSLEAYCKSAEAVLETAPELTTTTIGTSPASTLIVTSTSNPSSGTALKLYHEGQPASAVMMCTIVAAMTLAYFSVLA